MLSWRSHGRCLLSRRRYLNRSSPHNLDKLRRAAMIESAVELPPYARSVVQVKPLVPLSSSIGTIAMLKLLDEAMEAACDARYGLHGRSSGGGASGACRASSLTHFISECKRLRRAMGECRDRENRLLLRGSLRSFWAENVDGAVACCAQRGRDLGFIAGLGLADDSLHVNFELLKFIVVCIMKEKHTCACVDMMLALHYIARELDHVECFQHRVPASRNDMHNSKQKRNGKLGKMNTSECGGATDSQAPGNGVRQEEVLHLRRTVASLGVERIHFFFLQRGSSGSVLGSAEDALHALEFLAVVRVDDAEEAVCDILERTRPRWCRRNDTHITSSLFRHVASNYRDLKFTSVVHAFRLLRIFLSTICPSSPADLASTHSLLSFSKGTAYSSEAGCSVSSSASGGNVGTCVPSAGDDFIGLDPEYREWKRHHEIVDRVVFGLFAAVRKQDSHFINSLHFVQIVETISRLPPYLLSRAPHPGKKVLNDLTSRVTTAAESQTDGTVFGGVHSEASANNASLEAEEVWSYLVSKACIFIPGLSSDQRCRVCRLLRIAVARRERVLSCTAREILQPMEHELLQYPVDYQAVMFDRGPSVSRAKGRMIYTKT